MKTCSDSGCTAAKAPGRSRCYPHYRQFRINPLPFVQPKNMRILFIDIETTPNEVYTWGLFNQNIGINQIIKPGGMMCFSAKWLGSDETLFASEWADGREEMVRKAHDLLDEAHVVVHYYGSRFDIPHLNREFLLAGLTPPSPFRQVDLKFVASKNFKFTSNKLQFVAEAVGLVGKVEHEGFSLWTKCMAGDADALARMQEYNERDTVLLEELYHVLLPWIQGLPNRHLYDGTGGCPACGADGLRGAGFYHTTMSKFRQWKCAGCGSFFRSNKREAGIVVTKAVL